MNFIDIECSVWEGDKMRVWKGSDDPRSLVFCINEAESSCEIVVSESDLRRIQNLIKEILEFAL